MTRVMSGVRVVEVASYAMAPLAGAVLADWGAEVIKVEHPVSGDPIRGLVTSGIKPGTGGFTYLWEICNRGKRSVGLDISIPEGRELLLDLIEDADVFLTSLLPPARRRLRIDVDDIRSRNRRIIYARGSGHGPRGPDADRGGFDASAYWQRSGAGVAASGSGAVEPVGLPSPAFGDGQSGMFLAGGIAAALFHRERTGEGSVVDTSLLGAGLWAMQAGIVGSHILRAPELPKSDRTGTPNPLANTYRTSDGRHVVLMMLASDQHWEAFCRAVGRSDLAADARFRDAAARRRNRRACVEMLDIVFAAQPLAHWVAALNDQSGPWSVVQTPQESGADVQAVANGYTQMVDYGDGLSLLMISAPVQFDETRDPLHPAPEHAADTEGVLLERGLTWERISELKASGALT